MANGRNPLCEQFFANVLETASEYLNNLSREEIALELVTIAAAMLTKGEKPDFNSGLDNVIKTATEMKEFNLASFYQKD